MSPYSARHPGVAAVGDGVAGGPEHLVDGRVRRLELFDDRPAGLERELADQDDETGDG